MGYFRTKIRIITGADAEKFVRLLNSDGTSTKYMLESEDGTHRVNARSLFGVLYFSADHPDDTYFINVTEPEDMMPNWLDEFRA